MTEQAEQADAPSPEISPAQADHRANLEARIEKEAQEGKLKETEKDLNHAALSNMDMDDYVAEREDQEAGDLSPQRQQARAERYQRLLDRAKQDTADALAHEPVQAEPAEDRIQEAGIVARAELRIEQYEKENPGFWENVKATIGAYGDLTMEAAKAIIESSRAPEILDLICQQPEAIERLNQMPQRELERHIARIEGRLDEASDGAPKHPPIKPKTVSTAPKPVPTVSGKNSVPASKQVHEMDMDEYARYWHARERNAD